MEMSMDNKKFDNDGKGALWIKVAKSGRKYMGGEITINGQKHYISVFKNDNKQADNQPDFNMIVNEPKGNYVKKDEIKQTDMKELWNQKKGYVEPKKNNPFDDQDVPF